MTDVGILVGILATFMLASSHFWFIFFSVANMQTYFYLNNFQSEAPENGRVVFHCINKYMNE